MQRRWIVVVAAIAMLGGAEAFSGPVEQRLEPTVLVRGKGKPELEKITFSTEPGTFTIHLSSPASGESIAVSSAMVWLDGVQIAGPSDFDGEGASLTFEGSGEGSHCLEVELRGKPGGTMELAVEQELPCFGDDFSTNPLTSGKWREFFQDIDGPADALVWDEQDGNFALAIGTPTFGSPWGSSGWMSAEYELPDSGWTAELDYRSGGGTLSDGLLIHFNSEVETLNGNPVIKGYFVFLDNFQNGWDPASNFVGLYYIDWLSSPSTLPDRLDWVSDSRTRDDTWHHLKIDVEDGRVRVYIDDMSTPILDHVVSDYDLSRNGFGIGALTRTDDFIIDNVEICPK